MQKNSKNKYSKLAVSINSKGRLYNERKSLLRSPYQRDRDRIIHSTSFRGLNIKLRFLLTLAEITIELE